MKKNMIILASASLLFIGGAVLTSCGEQGKTTEADAPHEHETSYSCPMKCEGEKTYAEAGKCGACGMDLEAIADAHDHEGHDH